MNIHPLVAIDVQRLDFSKTILKTIWKILFYFAGTLST